MAAAMTERIGMQLLSFAVNLLNQAAAHDGITADRVIEKRLRVVTDRVQKAMATHLKMKNKAEGRG